MLNAKMRRVCWTILSLLIAGAMAQINLRTIYSWKTLEFLFPNEFVKEVAIRSGSYVAGVGVPIDVDVYNGGLDSKVFVTIPRFQKGVPVTLGSVTDRLSAAGNPVIAPFPNWEYNVAGNCDMFTSVFRIQIDQCDRLWVIDTGVLEETRICPPRLHVFSLKKNTLLARYTFPPDQFKADSLFVTVAVDVRNADHECKDTFAYIADVSGFALIVYDYRNSRSWKIGNNLFYPYPPYGTFHIKDDTFDLMDGIIGLALGPLRNNDRILYFHSLASRVESWVPTSVIRNYTLFAENSEAAPRSFVAFDQERSSQSAAEAMDDHGVLFFGLMSELAIGCWNSRHYPNFGGSNNERLIVDSETLQFPSGLKIISSKKGKEELWVLSASFQKFMSGSLNKNEINFRIQAGFVNELVHGTKCDVTAMEGKAFRFSK
ncbi:yellow-e3 [Megachile rotundata]|uniref:yellow-e3 n=1 Tax=Megachile rotundata TaxID=143995 RepID=UPI003FD5CA17